MRRRISPRVGSTLEWPCPRRVVVGQAEGPDEHVGRCDARLPHLAPALLRGVEVVHRRLVGVHHRPVPRLAGAGIDTREHDDLRRHSLGQPSDEPIVTIEDEHPLHSRHLPHQQWRQCTFACESPHRLHPRGVRAAQGSRRNHRHPRGSRAMTSVVEGCLPLLVVPHQIAAQPAQEELVGLNYIHIRDQLGPVERVQSPLARVERARVGLAKSLEKPVAPSRHVRPERSGRRRGDWRYDVDSLVPSGQQEVEPPPLLTDPSEEHHRRVHDQCEASLPGREKAQIGDRRTLAAEVDTRGVPTCQSTNHIFALDPVPMVRHGKERRRGADGSERKPRRLARPTT